MRQHDCTIYSQFIKRYGNIVLINKNNEIITIFDVDASDEYKFSAINASLILRKSPISEVFIETKNELSKMKFLLNSML